MRTIYFLALYLFSFCVLAQSARTVTQQSDINLKGNNNLVKIIQAGTVVNYDLSNERDGQKLLNFVIEIPIIAKQIKLLRNDIKNQNKDLTYLKKIVIDISQSIANNGVINIEDYNKALEKYILKNKQLEDEIFALKLKYRHSEYFEILEEAGKRLAQFDNNGYQQVLEKFKNRLIANQIKENHEISQLAYLQASNSYNSFNSQKAFEQVQEAIKFDDTNPSYWLLKGVIQQSLYHSKDALESYQHIDIDSVDDSIKYILYNNIGTIYNEEGHYRKAIEYYNSILPRLPVTVPTSTNLAFIYDNLGDAYLNEGMFQNALKSYTSALNIRRQTVSYWSYESSISIIKLGNSSMKMGLFDRAIKYLDTALEIQLKVLGNNDPRISATYNNLGRAYEYKGQYEKAIIFYKNTLNISLKIFGENHPNVASCYDNIGSALVGNGMYTQAIDYCRKGLIIRKMIFGENHLDVAGSYNNLGIAYIKNKLINEAGTCFLNALNIQTKILGSEHQDIAVTYSSLAMFYNAKGESENAIQYYNKSLSIQSKILGTDHPNIANLYNNIGGVYFKRGSFIRAVENYTKALDIQIKVFGLKNFNSATVYNNLGATYTAMSEYSQSIINYSKALDILLISSGNDHPNTQICLDGIAYAYIANNQIEKGISVFQQVKGFEVLSKQSKILHIYELGEKKYRINDWQTASNFFIASSILLEKYKIPLSNDLWPLTYYKIAIIKCKLGNKIEYSEYCKKSLRYNRFTNNNKLKKEISIYCSNCTPE